MNAKTQRRIDKLQAEIDFCQARSDLIKAQMDLQEFEARIAEAQMYDAKAVVFECLNCGKEIAVDLEDFICEFYNGLPFVCPHCDTEIRILGMRPIADEGKFAFEFDLRAHIKGGGKPVDKVINTA